MLKQILTKLEKLDKIELDVVAVKNDIRQIGRKVDNISEVVAKTMEDVVELRGQLEKQDIELKVLKGAR
jgi:hypothetical protein